MELSGKNILLISPEPWNHIFVSKHHYALHLSKAGNRVFFLNPPAQRFFVESTQFDNLFSMFYPGFIKGLRFFPGFLRRYLIWSMFVRLERIAGFKFDVVWSFDNSVFFDFNALGKRVFKILHIVDLNQDFQFGISARTADLCLSPNRFIVDKFSEYNKRTHFINHGVSEIGFASKKRTVLPGHNKIKACYAGNLDIKYLDWDLVETIVNQNPDVDFIMAGPCSNNARLSQLQGKINLFHVGVINSDDLASFYSASDVLILCYKADEYREQLANPHKMMEYLASGKMICATLTHEYQAMTSDGLFLMSETRKSYAELFRTCILNLGFWNNVYLQKKRMDFAYDNTYERQLNRIQFSAMCELQETV